MNNKTIDWLLEGDAWVRYRARVDLLGEAESVAAVKTARKEMLADPKIQALLAELSGWPGSVLTSHKSAGHPFHKLAFIADLGLTVKDQPVKKIADLVVSHQSGEGPYQVMVNIPKHFGGKGVDEWAWALCDAPVVLAAVIKMGVIETPGVRKALEYLDGLVRDNGWPCAISPEQGKFRGPGKKDDPCPYATLVMLKALSLSRESRESSSAKTGVDSLLSLWSESKNRHPYMFYMGTDFRKLKAPLFWYDILHVLDVVSGFTWAVKDARFKEMLNLVESKADDAGRYVPESIWTAWKDWDFCQKKLPSRGLTFFVERIKRRAGR
jgi:hypothetical protein